jgi:gamma-glutamylcyclotransferase (GGCT)/AIG2-like uncharacterized protein YtfP
LHDFGPYPGLLLPGDEIVHGELFALPDDRVLRARVWQTLDTYEDFRPESPETSLFTRVLTRVKLPGGDALHAWVYIFNQPVGKPA